MKYEAFHLSDTGFHLNWVGVRFIFIYLIAVGIHYDQMTLHGDLYQHGAMQVFPVKLWLTKPAYEFHIGVCPSCSLAPC